MKTDRPYPPPKPLWVRLITWLLIASLIFPALSPLLLVRADTPISYEYDDSDRIDNSSNDFTHDTNGSITADGQTTYVYDAANRLSQTVQNGITTTYKYDGWGNMVQQNIDDGTTPITTTDFVLDELATHTRILAEVTGSDVHKYAYGPEGLVAQKDSGGAVQYALLDHLGSVRHLSTAGGSLVRSFHYDVHGAIRHQSGSVVSPMRFTGERRSPDGTLYLRARHYLPARSDGQTVGRFLQRDSVDDAGNQHNRYAYAGNNGVMNVDPSGHAYIQHIEDPHYDSIKPHHEHYKDAQANYQRDTLRRAKELVGSKKYSQDISETSPQIRYGFPYNLWNQALMCNFLVHDVIYDTGVEPPTDWRRLGPDEYRFWPLRYPITVEEWLNGKAEIWGWKQITKDEAKPGDIYAVGSHMGIVSDIPGNLISASSLTNRVEDNDYINRHPGGSYWRYEKFIPENYKKSEDSISDGRALGAGDVGRHGTGPGKLTQ